MIGWCEKCWSIALDGWCSMHGETKAIPAINALDVRPLPEFEKQFVNDHIQGLKLGDGIFIIYGDRQLRKIVIALDKPLVEIKLQGDNFNFTPLAKGYVKGMNPDSLFDANSQRLERLTKVSKAFAQQELESNKNALISFSGGKDSVVLVHLLKDYGLRKVFIDTTIEFPETYRFISYLKNEGWDIDTAKAKENFFRLFRLMGYPERRNRWCCKTQKFEPFERYIKEHFKGEPVLVFGGERRWESVYRIDEPFKRQHRYITNQCSVHPMLDWFAMDVWIYTWKNKLPVNELYNYYERAGCWLCPFGLTYRAFLMKHAHPRLYEFLQKVGAMSKSQFNVHLCTEGKPMNHLVFSDKHLGVAVSKLLPSVCDLFEVHEDGKVVCVSTNIPKTKLKALIRQAKASLAFSEQVTHHSEPPELIKQYAVS